MRTLNDITPPSRRHESDGSRHSEHHERAKFPYATLIATAAVIIVSVGALIYFSTASVDVTPNTVSAAVQSSFSATKSAGDLPYEIVTAQKIATQSVKGSGSKTVSSYASGTITIMNAQPKAQKLIANTRFQTSGGLVYRIRTAVTIPGGTSAKPGTATAKAYADKPGGDYNVGPTSFTIPGFAGTPLATLVTARSSGQMSGGASGTVPVIDGAVESQARGALSSALASDLASSIQAQIPSGYTLLNGAATTTFDALESAPSSTTGMVDVKEQGTITAIVFPNAALAKAIATSVSGLGYQGEPVTLASGSKVTLTPTSGMPDPTDSSFSFSLSGTASLIYTVDPTRISSAVSGKTRSAAEVALTNYPEVKRAVIILRPFWRQTFPQDPASITVTVANP